MLASTTTKLKIKTLPPLKKGTKVQWTSQAGGVRTTKKGTIVCVLKKDTNHYGGNNLPKNFMIPLFRKQHKCTVVEAERLYAARSVWQNEWAMQVDYRLKFDLRTELYRNTVHYLVSVPQGKGKGQKPFLYHPASYTALKVIK